MVSPHTCLVNKMKLLELNNQKGFTFIEIMMAIGILTFIAGIGIAVSIDYYRTYAFRSERNTIVSLLQKARAASLNNINDNAHGVRFEEGNFVLFEGTSYDDSDSNNQIFAGNSSVTLTSSSPLPVSVIFSRLSAETTDVNFTLTDSASNRVGDISVSSAGQINW